MASCGQYQDSDRDDPLPINNARGRGGQLIEWIENPTVNDPPCPITANTLTYQQVQQEGEVLARLGNFLPSTAPIFPAGVQVPSHYIRYYVTFGDDEYTFFFAPGVIGLSALARKYRSTGPHPTDIALTIYQKEFGELHTLRHVFACGVVNRQTTHFLDEDLEERSMAQFGEREMVHSHTYMHGTPEYEALLGLRIPRTMGYLVLGAFPRGTRRIACFDVASLGLSYDIRCDIEPIA